MAEKHTYAEIAADYQLWVEFVDTGAAMTEAEFDALSIDRKVALQVEAFGPEIEMSKITVDDIRRLESEVGQFELCRKFATHVRKSLEPAYEGIELTSHGGLFRSDAAYAVDEALASVYRAAGYPVDHYYDLAVAIWDAKK